MPGFTVVETCPGVVVGSDLASIALWRLHGVLAAELFELSFRALGARGLGLGSVLHWGLGSGHGMAEAFLPLEALLLLSSVLHKLALVVPPFFCLSSLCEDSHVHEGVEIWVDLRGKQGPQLWVQAPY